MVLGCYNIVISHWCNIIVLYNITIFEVRHGWYGSPCIVLDGSPIPASNQMVHILVYRVV